MVNPMPQEAPLTDVRYVYGYGRTKHIFNHVRVEKGWRGKEVEVDVAHCGATCDHPDEQPERPVCKSCERSQRKLEEGR